MDASVMLGAALRHALTLLTVRMDGEGKPPGVMVANWRGLHFRRQKSVETQLARWTPDALRRAVARLQEAVLACRRANGDFAHAVAADIFLRLAQEANRRK
jgi:DNA polymerase-3 subunit delta